MRLEGPTGRLKLRFAGGTSFRIQRAPSPGPFSVLTGSARLSPRSVSCGHNVHGEAPHRSHLHHFAHLSPRLAIGVPDLTPEASPPAGVAGLDHLGGGADQGLLAGDDPVAAQEANPKAHLRDLYRHR